MLYPLSYEGGDAVRAGQRVLRGVISDRALVACPPRARRSRVRASEPRGGGRIDRILGLCVPRTRNATRRPRISAGRCSCCPPPRPTASAGRNIVWSRGSGLGRLNDWRVAWHRDRENPDRARLWDGTAWTEWVASETHGATIALTSAAETEPHPPEIEVRFRRSAAASTSLRLRRWERRIASMSRIGCSDSSRCSKCSTSARCSATMSVPVFKGPLRVFSSRLSGLVVALDNPRDRDQYGVPILERLVDLLCCVDAARVIDVQALHFTFQVVIQSAYKLRDRPNWFDIVLWAAYSQVAFAQRVASAMRREYGASGLPVMSDTNGLSSSWTRSAATPPSSGSHSRRRCRAGTANGRNGSRRQHRAAHNSRSCRGVNGLRCSNISRQATSARKRHARARAAVTQLGRGTEHHQGASYVGQLDTCELVPRSPGRARVPILGRSGVDTTRQRSRGRDG